MAIFLDSERWRHNDISCGFEHHLWFNNRHRNPRSSSFSSDDADSDRTRPNNRHRKDARPSESPNNSSDRRLPRPKFKSGRLRPTPAPIRVSNYEHLPCNGPFMDHLHWGRTTDHQVPLFEGSSSSSRIYSESSIEASCHRNGVSHRPLSTFSEQAIKNKILPGEVMHARDRLNEKFRASSLLSNRMTSVPLAATRVDNYAAIDEYIHLTDAENRETDARNLLASRISESQDLVEWDFSLRGGSKPPALTKMAICSLQREAFIPRSTRVKESGNENLEPDQEDCPVCLEEFFPGEQIICLPCFHRFHIGCLTQWLIICGECPFCRAIVHLSSA